MLLECVLFIPVVYFTFHNLGTVEVCAPGVRLIYLRCLFHIPQLRHGRGMCSWSAYCLPPLFIFLLNEYVVKPRSKKHWNDDLWSIAYFTIGFIETWHRYWWTHTPQWKYRLKLELNNLTKESILIMHFSKHFGWNRPDESSQWVAVMTLLHTTIRMLRP